VLKLGIIGAENSHSYAIAKICNIDKQVPVEVTMIWGETPEFAKAAAEKGAIPTIVNDWKEMLGKVDGIMIDHRHAEGHFEPAKFFVGKGVPTFVDKPFTFTLAQGKKLLDLAARKKAAITTFSAIPIQPAFQAFKQKLADAGQVTSINSTGPVDLKSVYGGVFFYGIHQVDAVVELMGEDVRKVTLVKHGDNGVATLFYDGGRFATINCIKEKFGGFHWQAATEKGILLHPDIREASPYLPSAKLIHELLAKKTTPFSRRRMLASVAILEALQKSLDAKGKPVNVAKF
jgi:predicted dehydrogenase